MRPGSVRRMSSLRCTVRDVEETWVVDVSGSVDLATVATLRDHVLEVISTHAGATIVIDLDEVVSLDDVGLGVLLGLAGRAREMGGDLRLVSSPGRVRDRLAITGADRAVDVASRESVMSSDDAVDDRPIFHLALPDDWERATAAGEYRISTRNRTLEDEGFIHCSFQHQLVDTANRYYGDLPEVVLLRLDARRLQSPVVAEAPAGAGDDSGGNAEEYPHVYGPITIDAVVSHRPWRREGDGRYTLAVR